MIVFAPLGSAARADELAGGAPNVQVCVCGDVRVVEGPWDAQVSVCGACRPVPVVICSRMLVAGRPSRRLAGAILRERMRLSGLAFRRGLAGDFRSAREGGRRRLLPLV